MLPSSVTKSSSHYFQPEKPWELRRFSHLLRKELPAPSLRPIILLCIGTDRATGDCLGPLTGHFLAKGLKRKKVIVYGTLTYPVHAGNLSRVLTQIHNHYNDPYIIAIDASLGMPEHIGYVTLGEGCLKPGAGVSQELPDTGDIHITGIVNASSSNNLLTLQTTHLSTVLAMSDFITSGLLQAL